MVGSWDSCMRSPGTGRGAEAENTCSGAAELAALVVKASENSLLVVRVSPMK